MKKSVFIFGAILGLFSGVIFVKNMRFKTEKESSKANILKVALYSDIATFHFSSSNKGSYVNSAYVMPWIFEGLMRKGENDIPELAAAEKVEVNRDQKKYTFHLRDSKWSDGAQVTAHDFAFAWRKLIDPRSKSVTPVPELFYPIKNARKFLSGECSFEEVGITVIDDKTLTIELEYPAHYFLEIMCNPFLFPAPKHIAQHDPDWCTKPGFVCNGPFTMKNRRLNSEIILTKNPLYWDQEHVYLEGINISIFEEHQTALSLFEKGELDWVGAPFMRMPYDSSFHTLNRRAEDSIIYFFIFNNDKYPFTNQKFRKALSYALDRSAIIENVFHDTAMPVMSALPFSLRLKNMPYFQDNNTMMAQTLLNEALAELQLSLEDLPEIELLYNANTEFSKQLCLAAQGEWRSKLNLKVSVRGLAGWNIYIDTLQKGDYQMAITGTMPPIFDSLFVLQIFENKSDLENRCNWENAEFKKLLRQSNYSLGELDRAKLLTQAEQILLDEMPIIPMCSMKKSYAKNPKLQGERLSYLQFVDFKSAYFEEN
ncbi:MAG: peptide ABC transporter substrate-binding protein [Chlamydiia bacterium]|nr:peptide ABC transporter substrate-binding protein [Chlamydiia bacterium]